MAINKPGIARKSSNKNPNIFSHEFVIQNHADIVSCAAMVFVIGLMVQATNSFASIFISLNHNVTGAESSQEFPRGIPFTYESGWKDWCAVFFYTLICIILHAILQEYVLDKISKRLHLSKLKLNRFNDSCQLIVFYLVSFFWGTDIILREGYLSHVPKLWINFPEHPMIYLHKLYFIIQLSYYFHMLPELYFQKVKKEDQQPKIIHAICSFSFIALAYICNFQRIALVLLTLHYFSEIIAQTFNLMEIFDREEKYANLTIINKMTFVITRFGTMVLSVLTLFYGINADGESSTSYRGLIALFAVFALQGYLVFQFINNVLKAKREQKHGQQNQQKTRSTIKSLSGGAGGGKDGKSKKDKKQRESDLPEADQQNSTPKQQQQEQKKIK